MVSSSSSCSVVVVVGWFASVIGLERGKQYCDNAMPGTLFEYFFRCFVASSLTLSNPVFSLPLFLSSRAYVRIYFADSVSKSANYCRTTRRDNIGVLALCEVALGDMYECSSAQYMEKPPKGYHSTWGMGGTAPTSDEGYITFVSSLDRCKCFNSSPLYVLMYMDMFFILIPLPHLLRHPFLPLSTLPHVLNSCLGRMGYTFRRDH